jgi:hypothetical protein
MTIRLTPEQEAQYDAGSWEEWRLLETINEELDRQRVTSPVAIVAADGVTVLCWLTEGRWQV